MKAITWQGAKKVSVEAVPEPQILDGEDAILKVTACAICGSDLHLYNGLIPAMEKGDVLGHEFMGEIVAVGKAVKRVKIGDRVVIPFNISCGKCVFCDEMMFSLCDRSNPNAKLAEKAYGASSAGLFGYSHLFGGFPGGQAEYVRVPYVDVGAQLIPPELGDEQALFLGDILSTGYMAAENCEIRQGDTVAVWGCGPVGQFAIRSAYMLGAGRVIAIDEVKERLELAQSQGKAEVINYSQCDDVVEELKRRTGGLGPHDCIDAVGMEAHGTSLDNLYDWAKVTMRLETDRPHVLRQIIQACRKGGNISIPGVYGGVIDKIPLGAAFSKGLTFRMGQTHTQRYMEPLLKRIEGGEIDPAYIITHRGSLDDAPALYEKFANKAEGCIKVVLRP